MKSHRLEPQSAQLLLPLVEATEQVPPCWPGVAPPAPDESRAPGETSVTLVRHRRARRYILRYEPDGSLRVTIPRGGSRHGALEFLERQRPWIERQQRVHGAASPADRIWRRGTQVLFRGTPVSLGSGRDAEGAFADLAGHRVAVDDPDGDLRPPVTRYLRRLALVELRPRLLQLADRLGIGVGRVTVRNQRSLWGSCSPGGTISLNWRLLQMPETVAEYVMVHELMHTRQANHSRRFWRLVAKACPHTDEARRWLRHHGRRLW